VVAATHEDVAAHVRPAAQVKAVIAVAEVHSGGSARDNRADDHKLVIAVAMNADGVAVKGGGGYTAAHAQCPGAYRDAVSVAVSRKRADIAVAATDAEIIDPNTVRITITR